MLIFLIACVISFVPCIALFLWLRKSHVRAGEEGEITFKEVCNKALRQGIFTVLPVLLLSGVTYVLLRLTRLQDSNPLVYQALYTFIVLALAEEVAKYLAFKRVIKNTDYPYSWLDLTILMATVGIGFGLIESVIYAVGASVPVVLVRGICIPHAGYGYIVGYAYGKSLKENRPVLKWLGFILSWLLHGLYDFSLSEEFVAINDNLMFVALLLAVMDIVLVVMMVRFVRTAKRNKGYTKPLF